MQTGRGRQGLLPDFRLDLPGEGGGPGALGNVESTLAELKVIGAVETYYPRGGARARSKKGVERRAGLIAGEYRRPPSPTLASGHHDANYDDDDDDIGTHKRCAPHPLPWQVVYPILKIMSQTLYHTCKL